MGICSSSCSVRIPRPPSEGCGTSGRSGGISRIVFMSCSVKFRDITNLAEWCEYINLGLIRVTAPIMGQKAADSATKQRFDSCSAETTTGFTRSITFNDFSADNDTFTDYVFWNAILRAPQNYQMGFITCDGLFYGFIPEFSADVDIVIPETNLESSMWDGTLSWQELAMVKPIFLPNLENILLGNCQGIPNFTPCTVFDDVPLEITTFGSTELCTPGGIFLSVPYAVNTTYQWQLDGNNIPGANSNEYTATEEGDYTVVISQFSCGTYTTDPLTITASVDLPTALSYALSVGPPNYTVTITATGADQYRIILQNGSYTPWQTSNVFTEVYTGNHTIQARDSASGCTAQIPLNI